MLRAAIASFTLSLVLAVGAGCGGDSGESSGIEFTRTDGSAPQLPTTLRAWCGPFDEDNAGVESVHMFAGEFSRAESPGSYWMLSAVLDDLAADPATSLPNDFVYTEPVGASVFVYDAEDRENELSSATEESSGTIRVESEGCELGDAVTVHFDNVVLGSEYSDLPTMFVSGTAEAEIGEPLGP